ncbi:MAG: glycosyltransferase family 2 protein [Shimia sp.]|nr:glycosyltransferase family 2 protein [Shimia sp.]
MSDAPRLLTVILNWRTPEMTLRAAQAAAREMDGLNGRIVIVDNDSGDGSFETIKAGLADAEWAQQDRVEVIQSGHNGGFGAGNNVGIRHGAIDGFDYVYILNSDAFPDASSIQLLLAHLTQTPDVGIAGSYIHGEDGAPHLTAFRFPSVWSELEGAARLGAISKRLKNHIVPLPIPEETTRVDWLAGASMMIRREVLEDIGLFDETFFLYFEETDLCLRANRAGWPTDYVRASEVTHIGSVSTGMKTWQRMPQYWFDSRLHYFRKNHGSAFPATLAHVAGSLIWKLRRLVGRKPQRDPDWFLRDLITHYLGTFFTRTPRERSDIPRLTPRKEAKP